MQVGLFTLVALPYQILIFSKRIRELLPGEETNDIYKKKSPKREYIDLPLVPLRDISTMGQNLMTLLVADCTARGRSCGTSREGKA